MATIYHMGDDVCTIYGLPSNSYYELKDSALNEFNKLLKNVNFRYITAFTANSYQKSAGAVLKANRFKPIITFHSQHGDHENLTLWVKINKKAKLGSKEKITLYNGNCSISYGDTISRKVFTIVARKLKSKENFQPYFFRIKGTPIWYRVKENKVVEGQSFGKWKPIKMRFPILKQAAPDMFK